MKASNTRILFYGIRQNGTNNWVYLFQLRDDVDGSSRADCLSHCAFSFLAENQNILLAHSLIVQ
jgi:hypothetical protein